MSQHFEFHAPASVEEACALLAQTGDRAKVLAGGTALVNLLHLRLIAPEHVVSLHRVRELHYLHDDETTGLRIGALTTHREVERSDVVRGRFPMLSELEGMVGGVQIRNRASVGGSLAHADPRGDLAPGLIALRGSVVLRSSRATREVPVEQFVVDYYETLLRPDDLLTEVRVPPCPPGSGGVFLKYWTRTPSDFAVANVACVVTLEDGRGVDVSLGLGAVHRHAFRPRGAEAALRGTGLTPTDLARAGEIAAGECDPASDLTGSAEYKREMVRRLVPRAVAAAAGRAIRQGG